MTRTNKCSAMFVFATMLSNVCAANEDTNGRKPLMWTAGAGVSYPLVVSVSAGAIAPIGKRREGSQYGFPGVPAIHANVDIGLGGGMVSGGLSFPLEAGYGGSAVSVKGAALRTWLIDVGPDRSRTYVGGVVEWLIPSHPSGKLGLGYLREREDSLLPRDSFVYVYFGIGL